jgi:galactitol-specific phosphotransferase system IIB component
MKTHERKEKTTTEKIGDFLITTGFILEMEVSEFLKKKGYTVEVNKYFIDYDENKKREIDIIASKIINDIEINFVIECKQSSTMDWVFVCSDKTPSRYYNFLKYLPDVPYEKSIDKTRVFDNLRPLDRNIPLAQNSITRHVSGEKSKSNSIEIYECMMKLPKAVVDTVNDRDSAKKNRVIFFPIVVFSGQIFTADYDSELKVHEVTAVQSATELDSDAYKYHYKMPYSMAVSIYGEENKDDGKKNSPVASTSNELGSRYLIEFITKDGLEAYLTDVENRISKIDLSLWPLKKENAAPAAIPF